jgi:hypothetical protein
MVATLQKMPSTTLKSTWSKAEMIKNLNNAKFYKNDFVRVANALKIPVWVLAGKSAVESGGTQYIRRKGGSTLDRSLTMGFPENDNYVGLMQVGSIPCVAGLQYISDSGTYSTGRLIKAPKEMQQAVMPIIRKYLPKFDPKNKNSARVHQASAFNQAKNHPEFNILMGGLIMCILLYNPRYNEQGIIRLDKISSAYNTGEGYKAYDRFFKDTASLLTALPTFLTKAKAPETSSHILKLCGVDGAYDLLSNNKFIF